AHRDRADPERFSAVPALAGAGHRRGPDRAGAGARARGTPAADGRRCLRRAPGPPAPPPPPAAARAAAVAGPGAARGRAPPGAPAAAGRRGPAPAPGAVGPDPPGGPVPGAATGPERVLFRVDSARLAGAIVLSRAGAIAAVVIAAMATVVAMTGEPGTIAPF